MRLKRRTCPSEPELEPEPKLPYLTDFPVIDHPHPLDKARDLRTYVSMLHSGELGMNHWIELCNRLYNHDPCIRRRYQQFLVSSVNYYGPEAVREWRSPDGDTLCHIIVCSNIHPNIPLYQELVLVLVRNTRVDPVARSEHTFELLHYAISYCWYDLVKYLTDPMNGWTWTWTIPSVNDFGVNAVHLADDHVHLTDYDDCIHTSHLNRKYRDMTLHLRRRFGQSHGTKRHCMR